MKGKCNEYRIRLHLKRKMLQHCNSNIKTKERRHAATQTNVNVFLRFLLQSVFLREKSGFSTKNEIVSTEKQQHVHLSIEILSSQLFDFSHIFPSWKSIVLVSNKCEYDTKYIPINFKAPFLCLNEKWTKYHEQFTEITFGISLSISIYFLTFSSDQPFKMNKWKISNNFQTKWATKPNKKVHNVKKVSINNRVYFYFVRLFD